MPDQFVLGRAVVVAALCTLAVVAVVAGTRSTAAIWRAAVAWPLGLAAGIYSACALLDQWPRWSPLEDRDRLLAILLPLTLVAETAAAWPTRRRWLPWLVRAAVASVAAPILLFRTTYLADLAGPGSAEWSTPQAVLILLGLAVLLLAVWTLMAELQSRVAVRIATPVLGISCLAAAATVMLSGYFQGGLVGLPLAGALGGATLAAFVVPRQPNGDACLAVGTIGLFSLIVLGRFFGSLPEWMAFSFMLIPLLAWVAAIPVTKRMAISVRVSIAVVLVAMALFCLVTVARQRFMRAFGQAASTTCAPASLPLASVVRSAV